MAPRVKFAACFVLFSCGGAPRTPEPHPLPSATTTAPVAATTHAPSAALSQHVAEGAKLFAYADLEALFTSQLGRGLAPNIVKLASGDVGKCIDALATAGKEILYSSGAGDTVIAVRFDPSKMSPSACPLTVVEPGIGVFGGAGGAGTLPRELALGRGEVLRVSFADHAPAGGTVEMSIDAHVSLALSDSLFALHADGDLPEARAREFVQELEDSRAKVPAMMKEATPEERDAIAKVLRLATFRRDGGHVSFAFDLHEPAVDQARDIGALAAVAISGMRKYLLQSKEAEARATLPVIARAIVADWEHETLPPTPRAKKKLRSFPPIPPTVPRGTKYQPSEKEWATWSTLKFEMSQPIYYQYEIRAAKDGESADVIARGDLNGDGKTSSFVITIKVKKTKDRSLELSPIVETDPDE
jgi:type IV pilus assembly protein PilA